MRFSTLQKMFCCTIFTLTAICCTTNTNTKSGENNTDEIFTQTDLDNRMVFTFYQRNNTLFAGSNEGVFRNNLADNTTGWDNIGLGSNSIEIIDIIAWNRQEIMVAVNYEEYRQENEVIFKTEDGGENWISFNENFTGKNINNFLRRLTFDINSPDRIFALGGLPIARSTDRGLSWTAVFEKWGLNAFGKFIKIDAKNTNIVWSGGATNILSPSLVKSTDGGESWQRLTVIKNVETTVHDLIINRNNSAIVLAGLSGTIDPANIIRKSTDGGQSWQTVLEDIGARTLTQSARDTETIYASGRNQSGTLFFAASGDFGDTWEMVEMADGPAGVQVNDMLSVMVDGREVLYFGTNQGVYSYTLEE